MNPYAKISYSQFGEDMLVTAFLRQKVGFYVDIGAHHPYRFSNTAILHERGWRGLNVDADPKAIELMQAARPGDINVNVGVAAERGEMDFHLLGAGAINTFDEKLATQRADRGRNGTIRMQVMPLADILAEHMPNDTAIDYMNIDVEGFDDQAVISNDWAKWRPNVLTIEIRVDVAHLAENATYQVLRKHGYVLRGFIAATAVFRRREG